MPLRVCNAHKVAPGRQTCPDKRRPDKGSLSVLHSQLVFVPEKKKSLSLALERVEISLQACDLMPNRPPE